MWYSDLRQQRILAIYALMTVFIYSVIDEHSQYLASISMNYSNIGELPRIHGTFSSNFG